MTEERNCQPIEEWKECDVSSWLKSIRVNENFIEKMKEEEVDGQVLLELTQSYLTEQIGMKSGKAHVIIQKRNKLVESLRVQEPQKALEKKQGRDQKKQQTVDKQDTDAGATQVPTGAESQSQEQSVSVLSTKRDCKPRPIGEKGSEFTYLQHSVLQPESGVSDLITPCHEYKSFATAATLSRERLQAKFAREVFKFGSACMNMRSNGTIHFGVMDSKGNSGHVHGEVIGVPVKEKDMYIDAFDHIERSFSKLISEHVRMCIREPEFIKVANCTEHYVIEVDIVPEVSIVRNKVYPVRLPNFTETSKKVEFEKETIYQRKGANTEPVSEQNMFYQRVKDRDAMREKAEQSYLFGTPDVLQDLGRKLKMLVTGGKKVIDKDQWYILVTNKFEREHLSCIDFLVNMKIFCVFDFDPDSKRSGFCNKYLDHHAANLHFLQSYTIPSEMTISAFENHLQLFEQASWIFCNGRNGYRGNEPPCDEMTWIQMKKTLLKEAVSVICKRILPRGTFLVIFLLTSPVELPMVHTFYEFYAEMQGHGDIICISESEENHSRWTGYAQVSCSQETVNNKSVAGMKMSHVNATIQSIQPHIVNSRHLPTHGNALCLLETAEEERMSSLEILGVDQCDNSSSVFEDAKERENVEKQFYSGKVRWINFWLAENKFVGEFIQRDTYKEVSKVLNDAPRWSRDQRPVNNINIYHEPGSGGSTVARHVLWNNRKSLRCAVVKPSFPVTVVAEHAVKLREYEEKGPQKCLPVLLLVEDYEKDYLDSLRNELEVAMKAKKISQGTLCFVLLSCRQSCVPEKMCKESPLQNFAVIHKLSPDEKIQFARKMIELEEQHPPDHLLIFVLMSKEFERTYITKFVTDLLKGIDHSSVVTRLILFVALLNTHVQNSYLSQSHCEALLHLKKTPEAERKCSDRFRRHLFESSLSEQAKLLFIRLRNEKTRISFIRMINPLVAEEVLHQLLGSDEQQSSVAIDLLQEDVLFENSFGKEDYHRFLRDLCMRRTKISRGDQCDSLFSPLIDHIRKTETTEKAVKVLEEAYSRFGDDAFFAQQLARLHYTEEKFEKAKYWAEVAEKKKPNNSFILDTKGQVYKRWFNSKCKLLESENVTAENTVDAIAMALEAMKCFRESEAAANKEQGTMNNSGYFSEVDLAFDFLELIFLVFPKGEKGRSECLQYLLTEHIPEAVKYPWINFHSQLKNIHKNMWDAIKSISEDLTYFQTGTTSDDESHCSEIKVNNPIKWLAKRSSCYGKLFGGVPLDELNEDIKMHLEICRLGGGNMSAIFSLLSKKNHAQLEQIIAVCSGEKRITEIVTYIASQIALGCLSATSSKLATLQDLQDLSQQFRKERGKFLPDALFLQTLLFWPEDDDNKEDRDAKYEIVMAAVDGLKKSYCKKMKAVPQKEKRIFTHFFLGKGKGLSKIVHKSKMEMLNKLLSMSERRMKWLSGDVWKMPELESMLKRVQGWTKDGRVYIEGSQKKPFMIHALNSDSIPYENEDVEFYLGFTFEGPVANGITISRSNKVPEKQ
ncbi:sterile alpha motif domain-containing protein 9-like [Anguilla anguilla]|uniref:sterile alpha motif domain-containing protein 9-like n=1 Tax=Anguilla anguilla TaxID=7936 RepID=UPI0015A7A27B|nr:sterile alpha motif domain-containing protein 9-like [Anguilla anguilla]XP_035261268.1 sterile alpha motif domain-containing protein 9-like [Anguilla anguilla]